ncbi:hydrogenase expression/formation protein HypE [Anaerotaenia torta]|uniref:hydrogenase expression/formation protein HypE n=1 Tax=Anaerotaenia torta TaxID=433293 RepID=UPI003D1D5534
MMKITMSHGSGGALTGSLIHDIFIKHFHNPILDRMEDGAVLKVSGRVVLTTDSFVVTPMFFPGGDIGKLAVCGTVNDLAMMGAIPKYLTAGFIIEEGTELEELDRIAGSMAAAAKEARVKIVAGDTKVIEGRGGVYINTSGIGEVAVSRVSVSNCRKGDAILVSGNMGEHHAAIMSRRMGIENRIQSDCAPLTGILREFLKEGLQVHFMRDITRGGLATILNEITAGSRCGVAVREEAIPVSSQIRGFCDILGLDPLYMANEGKMLAVVPGKKAEQALAAMKRSRYGRDAAIIGEITEGSSVSMTTRLGGNRRIELLYGEGLPRIC